MSMQRITFADGAAYERNMGGWSRLAGGPFLDWLAPAQGLRWLDVGCGNGAFTELVCDRCAPVVVEGVDPSDGQLDFARTRLAGRPVRLQRGDAMALPFAGGSFDVAAMALVIFFVPDPAQAVAEMARVVRPGGTVAAYAWDFPAGGFPLEPIQAELRALGLDPPRPPHFAVARADALRALWAGAGLAGVETRAIVVRRSFAGLAEFWSHSLSGTAAAQMIEALEPAAAAALRARVEAWLDVAPDGRVTATARANMVRGLVPSPRSP
ncbi:class I SAM-dependent methyltransferase [Falsiroseomonas oryzae]|uniref:class I SAM-dependent methyltransferase n=1 Tax=Falsiroseomonas oryzae TaxID=2766473 RepID=UPI0022EB9E32|nr:class I SAM-dependent methyltransferase [Roseomonas sp. MO-31]